MWSVIPDYTLAVRVYCVIYHQQQETYIGKDTLIRWNKNRWQICNMCFYTIKLSTIRTMMRNIRQPDQLKGYNISKDLLSTENVIVHSFGIWHDSSQETYC